MVPTYGLFRSSVLVTTVHGGLCSLGKLEESCRLICRGKFYCSLHEMNLSFGVASISASPQNLNTSCGLLI